MKKPNQIRAVIEQSNPSFISNPERLQLFVDQGQIISTGTASLSFEYRYTLNVIITDYADDIARIIVPLLAYLKTNQPELFENPQRRENGIKYNLDYNNNDTLDLSIDIQLTERVVAKSQGDSTEIKYAAEPIWDKERVRVYFDGKVIFDSGEQPHGNG